MAGKHEQSPEHRKAHDLAETALERAADGQEKAARELADKAREIDPKIDAEMARELEQDRREADRFAKKDR